MKGFERDGAKWGVSDFYDEARESLLQVLRSGEDFDTGWYGVKKEIQSGRVFREGDTIYCEASCSDDFDTEGFGRQWISAESTPESLLEAIVQALDRASDDAEQDLNDNEVYRGWSVGQVGEDGGRKNWLYTYIQPVGEGEFMDEPPGDNYAHWGWEDQDPEVDCLAEQWAEDNGRKYPSLPQHVRDAFEQFVYAAPPGPAMMTLDGWRIDTW
jgi:hypothetical protein